ncbi:uncharacterized protein LOC133870255 [Alnus glutinosa]|uniref:uncharacterized protein LOC133870255 n=1 Tax=Alnus glutinosa TaxID=3517 RepID=UPI002D76DE1C|nr:uncharacterized protein LOC133870255 [Alnus glutinosa]
MLPTPPLSLSLYAVFIVFHHRRTAFLSLARLHIPHPEIARDVLVILISIVASESAFSNGRRVLDPFRSPLSTAQSTMRKSWRTLRKAMMSMMGFTINLQIQGLKHYA